MLIKLLSRPHQESLRDLARLLSIADKPFLRGGKMKEEITSNTNTRNLSFKQGRAESSMLMDWSNESCTNENGKLDFSISENNSYEMGTIQKGMLPWVINGQGFSLVLEALGNVPLLGNTEHQEIRWPVVLSALRGILDRLQKHGSSNALDSRSVKIVLFELISLALADGNISEIESHFLKEFANYYHIDKDTFNEIHERAETMSREQKKTIEIILE